MNNDINSMPTMRGDRNTTRRSDSSYDLDSAPTMRPQTKSGVRNGFSVGDIIMDSYVVRAELGRGGMGVVYKCFYKLGKIDVALKALPPELSQDEMAMEDIRDNFAIVESLNHPNIANVKNIEHDKESGTYYLIMEYAEGETLRSYIKKKRKSGEITLAAVLPILRQIASALDYAHEKRVLHRDIKPENIMVDKAGNVKLLDFGLADRIHTSMSRVSVNFRGTSGTGPYMSPEQWRGRRQGAASDQYALAVIVYEILAGNLPFESSDTVVLKQAVLDEVPEEIKGIPANIQAALNKAMSKNAEDRFESCTQFVDALEGRFKVGGVRGGFNFKRPGKGFIGGIIVVVLITIGVVLAVKLWPDNKVNPVIVTAENVFTEKADELSKDLTLRIAELHKGGNPILLGDTKSFDEAIEQAINDAESLGVESGFCKNYLNENYNKIKDTLATEVAEALKRISEAFKVKSDDAIAELKAYVNEVSKSTNPESYYSKANDVKKVIADSWQEAEKNGVNESLYRTAMKEYEALTTKLNGEVTKRRKELERMSASEIFVSAIKEYIGKTEADISDIKKSGKPEAFLSRVEQYEKAFKEAQESAVSKGVDPGEFSSEIGSFTAKTAEFRGAVMARSEELKLLYAREYFEKEANQLIDNMSLWHEEIEKSDNPGLYFSKADELKKSLDNFWNDAKTKGVEEASYENVIGNYKMAMGVIEKSIETRVAKLAEIKFATELFQREAKKVIAQVISKCNDVVKSDNPASYSSVSGEAKAAIDNLWDTARAKYVKVAVFNAIIKDYDSAAGKLGMAIDARKKELAERRAATELFKKEVANIIGNIDTAIINAATSNKPESFKSVAAYAKTAIENAWKAASDKGVDAEIYTAATSTYENAKKKLDNTVAARRSAITAQEEDIKSGKKNIKIELPDGVAIDFVRIGAGSFMMGSPDDEKGRSNSEVLHKVTISKDFYMGKYEVSQAQWDAVMPNKKNSDKKTSYFIDGGGPVESVSWDDAQRFIEELNKSDCAPEGYIFRLPTEAEWEYACRAGTHTAYSFDDELNKANANFDDNVRKPARVTDYIPNNFGLYNMHGNVYEWCQDYYGPYDSGGVTDPQGPKSGNRRVARGGAWDSDARYCRSANRFNPEQTYRRYNIGFRLVLSAE